MSSEHKEVLDLPWIDIFIGYLKGFCLFLCCYAILHLFWSKYSLVDFADIWRYDATGLGRVWFIFAWGIIAALILPGCRILASKWDLAGRAVWVSFNAGFWEELIYRWLYFFSAMIILPFLNWITFGLVKWLYVTILCPVANFFTFGALAPQLHATNWILGAAVMVAVGSFRNAHEHLGILGIINSWFLGMVLFWLMFNFGLITAIVAHIVYDLVVYFVYIAKPKTIGLQIRT